MTVTLLAFLVILLVGLATYTRIETAVAGNTQRQAQARQNALLALNVALGQLQKSAGPDQRVTATAESVPGVNGQKAHYTGVWDSTTAGTAPLTWLVSGSENGASISVTAAMPAAQAVELVGAHTSGTANDVVVPLVDVKTYGVPGQFANDNTTTGGTTIGRYAWWVGDQGVKAPVAIADHTASVNYAPWDSVELNSRLRQQMGLGAGPADANGNAVFEPRDTTTGSPTNAALTTKTTSFNQLAFFNKPAGGTVGLTTLQQNYHAWSPNNFAVLANTKLGGLRQDLSLKPDLLGSAFAAWADYTTYMEDPTAPATVPPLPAYGTDPLRRRYKITTPISSGEVGVSPVLSYFYLFFGVRKQTAATPYTLGLRWAAALWNPYSSALVPEDLRLEISGLPGTIAIKARSSGAPVGSGTTDVTVSLANLYGNPLKVKLPWDSTTTVSSDRESWLPGRTYNWVSTPDATFAAGSTNAGRFYSRSIPALTNGLVVSVPGSASVNGNSVLTLTIPNQTTLTVKLVRDSDGKTLATYTSPTYEVVTTTDEFQASGNTSPVGFIFRMSESFDTVATDPSIWLTTQGRDPRSSAFPADGLTTAPKGLAPTDCKNFTEIKFADRFFDRDITNGTSYNEDLPFVELPRSPIVSLGELQHFFISGARPFAIGNSWGDRKSINGLGCNELFDRFYFSGLVSGVSPTSSSGALQLPNPLLKTIPRDAIKGTPLVVADLRNSPNGQSSKFLFQGGAFNINSLNGAAWAAALRSGRFSTSTSFSYLDCDATTGTADDSATVSVQPTDAQFFRFAQSAQENFKADEGYEQSESSFDPKPWPVINTPLFRRGARTIDATLVTALANAIVDGLRQKHFDSGPFRTIEEFLAPSSLFVAANGQSVSLIEEAIDTAGINSSIAEFSSQWLTQGDIMTALAPVLFPRSDTFVIRTYGEAVNPTTGATEGKAWCEATVQRVPEYFDKAADAEEVAPAALSSPLNQTYGRRFKIVSFRWLTHSDI